MKESGTILDYSGFVDHKKINHLLNKLKKDKDFLSLHKTTGKRLYAILVECLENIARYSVKESNFDKKSFPFVSVIVRNDKILVKSGNPVYEGKTILLDRLLNKVNSLEDNDLSALYEKNINREFMPEENGAGLGFIIMKLKSGNRIDYSFANIRNGFSYFSMQISLNKYIMRKLIIEKTASSPGVILDPDKNVYKISGESRPPDVSNFYGEILNWFDDFSHSPYRIKENSEPVAINFDFEYFNSSSAKYLLDFCKQIAKAKTEGMDIIVNWHYEENDLDMLEAGREMSRISRFPFEFKHV